MNDTSTNPQPPSTPSPSPVPPPPPIAFGPAGALPPAPLPKNPGAAGALGIIPGMGHLYLGLYQRAAILFGVWVLFISVAGHSHGPFPGIAIPFWMVFSIIDASRQAKAINATGRPESNILGSDEPVRVSGSLTAGLLLILIGGFLLLDRSRDDRPVVPERLVAGPARRLRRVAGVPPLPGQAAGLGRGLSPPVT